MNPFIENMLNPPPKFQVGQIWWNYELKRELVISDTKLLKEEKVVRTMLIGSSSLYNDLAEEYDIKIPKGDTSFPSERTIFILTSGPTYFNQLNVFVGILPQYLIKKIINAEKNYLQFFNLQKNSQQSYYLRHEYEKLFNVRMNAINIYETAKRTLIFTLDQSKEIVKNRSTPMVNDHTEPYRIAADDNDSKKEKIEVADNFWDLELENSSKALEFINSEKLVVRLNQINDVLYLIFYTSLTKEIKNIVFTFNDNSSRSRNLTINNKAAATPLNEIIKGTGEYKLSFEIEYEKYSFDFEIK